MKKLQDPRELALCFLKESSAQNIGKIMQSSKNLSSLEKRDSSFCNNLVHETLRNLLFIDSSLSKHVSGLTKLPDDIAWILRIGTAQLFYFTSVPDYAAIDTSVELAKKYGNKKFTGLVNAVLRKVSLEGKRAPSEKNPASLSIKHSVPRWLIEKWSKDFGKKRTVNILDFFYDKRPICFRTVSPSGRESLIGEINREGFKTEKSAYSENAFYSSSSLISSRFFGEGQITVQDESSILTGEIYDIPDPDVCIDLCAAPGGKALLFAKKSAFTVACDIKLSKMKMITENKTRLDLSNHVLLCVSDALFPPFSECSADLVIADVPCSGTGTLHKNPDLKLKLKKKYVESKTFLQLKILKKGSELVKKGGLILYSTCSIEKEENSGVVLSFLKDNKDFKTVYPKPGYETFTDKNGFACFFPDLHRMGGAFAALLKKAN